MTEAERDAFVEDKLACEHEKHLRRQEKLLDATQKVLAQKDLSSLLQTAADYARDLTGAKYAITGHGYVNGVLTAGGVSRSDGAMPCPPGEAFNMEKGGVYLDLIQEKNSIHLTDAEMRSHPAWWGLPEGHLSLRGLLGARLVDVNGQPNGLVLVTDKVGGGDFTAEDETILSQLAAFVSLALQHIEAREEAEKKSSELEATISSIADGVITYGPKGDIISMNKAAQELLSALPDDFNKIAIPERIRLMKVKTAEGAREQPDQSPTVRALKGETVRGEVRIIENPKTGRVIWTDNSAAPIYSADGRLLGSVATFTDITEKKLAEEALRKSEEMYRVLAENSDDFIYIIGKDDLVKYVNNSAARRLGLLPEEIIGKPRSSFFSKEVADGQKSGLDKAFETANTVHSQREANFGNIMVWQDTHLIPLKTCADEVYAVLGISRDVTKQKQAMNEIENLAKFPEENPNPVLRVAADGSIIYANRSSSQLLEQWGCRLGQMLPDDYKILVQNALQTGNTNEIDIKSGCTFYSLVLTPIVDKGYINIYGRDITERKLMEIALKESEEKFRLVADFTHDWETWLDPKGNYVYVSPSCERITGYSAEEFVKNPQLAIDLVHSNDREAFRDHRIAHFEGQTSTS